MVDPSEIVFSTKGNVDQYVIPRAEIVNSIGKSGVKSGDNREHGPLPGLTKTLDLGSAPSHDYFSSSPVLSRQQ